MQGAAFALLCAVALVSAELNENGCPTNPYIDVLIPHPNCNKFYQCLQGDLYERKCASTLVFNVETQECDWPENVDCENRTPVVPVSSEEAEGSGESGNGNNDPSLAPEICAAEGSDGILVAHEQCNKFYQCHNGGPVVFGCAPLNLVFNPSTGACDWPENVDCGNRIPGGDSDNGNGDSGHGNGNGDGDAEDNNKNNSGEDDNNSNNGNDDPSLAPKICAAKDSDGILVAHETCNKFYQCHNGVPVEQRCAPVDLVFNPSTGACDWPENVDCGNRTPGGDGDSGNGNGDGGNGNGDNGNGEDNNNDDNSSEDGNDSGNGGGNDNPSLAPEICATENSNGVLVAHEHCNKFYICNNGEPVERRCAPVDLVFNPSTGACDWPENVDCGNRTPVGDGDSGNGNGDGGNGNGDNGNGEDNNNGDNSSEDGNDSGNGGGNDNPSLAPEICAAENSNGVLVAHEHCNKFYICNNGVPVERRCAPVDLVFNPSTGACDWPENVDCGNRTPGGDGDSGNGDGGNGNGDNGNGENNNNGDNSSEYGNDSGNGGGNDNPSLAPEICAAENSNGVLVAHEHCNKFYICNNGVPVERRCAPVDLVFNPSTGACDWPENVDCGNRTPGGDGDSGNGNGDGGNGNGDNGNGEDNNNGDNSSEDGNDSGNGGGNDNPSLAPEICAAENSNGVLVAHEHCNKFYICNNGVPVERRCAPVDLVFNPSTGACDWPENVDCGNRTPGGDGDSGNGNGDGGNGNGDNGNGEDNNNGDNSSEDGNDSGNGGGNYDPSLATEICAAENSNGVLVAHEHCNKFYICNNGVPVERRCAPVDLVFNPSIGACDWPENVDCGNRIPGGDGDSGNGNGDGGNGNGDNGNGEDNNNGDNSSEDGNDSGNGGGNYDPSLAPEICAAENSNGVLVAHEHCNKFYICNNGVPVERRCAPVDLVFNPSTGACDWPENVDCGNRTSGNDSDNGNGDGDNEDGGNGEENNSSDGDKGNGEEDNGNNAGGGNGNPSEAPEICAVEGSDGVLIAHESCDQFYTCSEGKPVALICPPTLLFNPNNDQCDWPENVNCDDRNPDSGHGDSGNENNGNGDSDNGNGDGDNESNAGGGNADPSKAPEICATEGSDSVLVAHENCNQFYVCSDGSPVVFDCPPGLLFNPTTDVCDWPENVDCGTRYRFTSFNKHLRRFLQQFRTQYM